MIDILLLILFIFILWSMLAAAILYKAKLKEENKQDIIKDYTSRGILPVPYGNEQKSVVEPLADDAPITEWMARRPFLMGQAAGAIDNVLPAKDIVHEMVSTAVEHLNMASKYVVSKM